MVLIVACKGHDNLADGDETAAIMADAKIPRQFFIGQVEDEDLKWVQGRFKLRKKLLLRVG